MTGVQTCALPISKPAKGRECCFWQRDNKSSLMMDATTILTNAVYFFLFFYVFVFVPFIVCYFFMPLFFISFFCHYNFSGIHIFFVVNPVVFNLSVIYEQEPLSTTYIMSRMCMTNIVVNLFFFVFIIFRHSQAQKPICIQCDNLQAIKTNLSVNAFFFF